MTGPQYLSDPVPAGMLHAGAFTYWLVKRGGTAGAAPYAAVTPIPNGYQPIEAKTGGAVLLGSTTQAITNGIAAAANKLGVPNPQNIPSLNTTLGILGAEITGAAAGAAGAATAAADAATAAAGTADTAAAGTAGGTAGGDIASKIAASTSGKVAGAGLAGVLGLTSDWQQLIIRGLEALAGIALLLLGLQALTGMGAQGNPIKAARSVAP